MAALRIDGQAIAETIHREVQARVERLAAQAIQPGLAVVLVGEDPASATYTRTKSQACAAVGIACTTIRQPATITQNALLGLIHDLNADGRIHGVLVQQPLPAQIDVKAVMRAVVPEKDVDGLHPCNLGLLLAGEPRFIPCTAAAVQELLLRSGCDPAGKRTVILGRSNLVGKPLAALLMQKARGANATVTLCHSATPHLAAVTSEADILVAAVGKSRFVTAAMVQSGAVVIDVGINRIADERSKRGYRLAGDVDFAPVAEKAGAIAPVPGGVGPMTVAMLLVNTVKAAEAARSTII